MRIMKFFRKFVIMHPGTERNMGYFLLAEAVKHMMFIGQYLSKQFVILFLAWNERLQTAKYCYEFVHNRLNAGLDIRCSLATFVALMHFPEFGTGQTMRSEDSKGIRWTAAVV